MNRNDLIKDFVTYMLIGALIGMAIIMLTSCETDTIKTDGDGNTKIINDTIKIGVADKLKEIEQRITARKDSIIELKNDSLESYRKMLKVMQVKIDSLSKIDYVEDIPDKMGQLYKGYTLKITVTKDSKYQKYPNRVHGEVMIKDKVFHHYTIYSADCSVQKSIYAVKDNLKNWVDK
jgi:hypothetical protein